MKKIAVGVSTVALIVLFVDLKFLNPLLNGYVNGRTAEFPLIPVAIAVACVAVVAVVLLLVGFAAVVRRLTREKCSHCGAWSPKDADICPRCGKMM